MNTASQASSIGKLSGNLYGDKYGSSFSIGAPIYKSNDGCMTIGASIGRTGGWKPNTGTWGGGVSVRFGF